MGPRWIFLIAFALVFYGNGAIQVPIQFQLSEHGLSIELIDRLIETNIWLRRLPCAICAGLLLWMAAQAIAADAGR
jgi:hypothetical protein